MHDIIITIIIGLVVCFCAVQMRGCVETRDRTMDNEIKLYEMRLAEKGNK